jgi:hypothetical protein
MTIGDAVALALFLVPPAHLLIRRFQYAALRHVLLHTALFVASATLASGHAAGWASWFTIPALAIAAAASQYVFLQGRRGQPRRVVD